MLQHRAGNTCSRKLRAFDTCSRKKDTSHKHKATGFVSILHYVQHNKTRKADKVKVKRTLTWSLVRRRVSVVLFPPGFAAFQNCFCAEYLFIGHSLKRQSADRRQEIGKESSMSNKHHFLIVCVHVNGLQRLKSLTYFPMPELPQLEI